MPHSKTQVLLALRDPAPFAPLVQALMQQDAAVSLVSPHPAEELLERMLSETPSLLVLALDKNAKLLEQVREQHPQLPIIVVMGKATAELSFAASRLGAEDVLTLPLDEAETVERVQAVLQKITQQKKPQAQKSQTQKTQPQPPVQPLPKTLPLRDAQSAAQPAQPAALPARPVAPPVRSYSDSYPNAGSAARETKESAALSATPSEPLVEGKGLSSESKNKLNPQLMGTNPRMAEIRDIVSKVAATDATVLIRGESGVGKEIVARMVFESSRRAQKPFIKVNCAAIPNDLLESELFGYEAGAFTGATRPKPGKFELAHHGTLFLDEIGEMHPLLQAKLLHVLQDGQFSRLGAKQDVSVDVRVLCATNKLLEQRVADGLFREDLYYRINVVTVHVPPLRERRDEIAPLTRFFLERYAAEYRRPLRFFSPEVERQMLIYSWPGNVRELENLCKRFVIVGGETQILRELSQRNPAYGMSSTGQMADKSALSAENSSAEPEASNSLSGRKRVARKLGALSLLEIGRQAAWQAERQAIQQMLQETHWNRKEAARRLGVSYKALLNKMKQIELEGQSSPEINERQNSQ